MARIEAHMQAVLPGAPYEIAHKTAYRVHERVADAYVHGRIFLAGDAAQWCCALAQLPAAIPCFGARLGCHLSARILSQKLVQQG